MSAIGFEGDLVFIATLIAAGGLTDAIASAATARLDAAGCAPGRLRWIDEGDAFAIPFQSYRKRAGEVLEGAFEGVDLVVQLAGRSRRRLLAADMDSTMIAVECIDELADYAGVKAEVAAVTEAAMRGDLDFEAALDARVLLLGGLEEGAIDRCREERVRLMPGARTLVATMRAHGAFTLLVSGGFTRFAEPVGMDLGFDEIAANGLDVAEGRLTGTVPRPIVGAEGKKRAMVEAAAARGIDLADALAVGDGANDLPMLEAAGLGVAFRAKPVVAAAADARIVYGDLTALLWAQGYARREWMDC